MNEGIDNLRNVHYINVNERTQAIYDSIDPPNELRNRIHLRNLALVHVALIISLMQRVAGSTVANDRHHGASQGMYSAHDYNEQRTRH